MISALVIFCEGPHDVHYVGRCLEVHSKFMPFEGNVTDLPTPFGRPKRESVGDDELGLVICQSRRLCFTDRSPFDEVNFSKKPLYEFAANRIQESAETKHVEWAIMVNCGGDSNHKQVIEVLTQIREALDPDYCPEVTNVRYAFIYDADFVHQEPKRGLKAREQLFWRHFGEYLRPKDDAYIPHGKWKQTDIGSVGLWVHHNSEDQQGTLEDHLLPMCMQDWSTELADALEIINKDQYCNSHARGARDKTIKAAITMAGQLRLPRVPSGPKKHRGTLVGAGLAVMVQKGISDTAFEQSESGKALANFLFGPP